MKIKNTLITLLPIVLIVISFSHACLEENFKRKIALKAQHKITEYKLKRRDYIISISIPKCGTHLINKCLDLLDIKNVHFLYEHKWEHEKLMPLAIEDNKQRAPDYFHGRYHTPTIGNWPIDLMDKIKKSNNNNRLFSDHWTYTKEADELFTQCNSAGIFIFRDPRDMLVSMAYFVHKGPENLSVDVNDLIFDFIDGRKKHFVPWAVAINQLYPLLYEHGVTNFYKLYLNWMKSSRFLTIKFEDLVGPQGGGTLEAQINTIRLIAKHLGVSCSDERIAYVIDNLFGTSATFREGKIGSWRKHFNEKMIAAYKKVPGACQLLIDLKYEKDMHW